MGAPAPGALPPISTDARAQLGERYAWLRVRMDTIARRRPGWSHTTWYPANPLDPDNWAAQGGETVTLPFTSDGLLLDNQGQQITHTIDVERAPAVVMWHVVLRVYGCGLFKMRSPNWVAELGSDEQDDSAKFGPGMSSSSHTNFPGHRYGQGPVLPSDVGPGWPVPMSGTFWTYMMLEQGTFSLSINAKTANCDITSRVWDINIWTAIL